ncbi:MAG: type II secretion system protein [Gemmatimonadota bacterium]
MSRRIAVAGRSGAVLLEVLIAMTIFSIASAVTLIRAGQARHSVVLARMSEDRLNAASAFMDRVVLWPREDLDRHLGTHTQGEWWLDIEHPVPQLYSIALLDGRSHVTLLDTMVYRALPSTHVTN